MPDAGENTGGRSRANGEGEIEPNNNHHQEVTVSLRANRSQDQMESIREKIHNFSTKKGFEVLLIYPSTSLKRICYKKGQLLKYFECPT